MARRPPIYGDDLAHIHIAGYGFHWEGAAPAVLAWLEAGRVTSGCVLDLGCGGGAWLERLADRGYTPCGVDVSPGMIRAARRRVPHGRFILGSFADVDLPPCDAVTSLGEPLNYLDGARAIRRVFRRVFDALRPGGLFIFDAREPADGRPAPKTVARVGDDWACIARIIEDGAAHLLRREITTFRRAGRGYRRSEEVHELKVYAKDEMVGWLRDAGFRVRTRRGYGAYRFRRQFVAIARKPQ